MVVAMAGQDGVVVGLEDLRFHWRREEKEWVTWWINPIDRELLAFGRCGLGGLFMSIGRGVQCWL